MQGETKKTRSRRSRFLCRPVLEPLEDRRLLTGDAAAVIGGWIWCDQNRNGYRDEGEQTLSSIGIRLLDADLRQVAVTSSDEAGHYQFPDLVPGQYAVSVDRRPLFRYTLQNAGADDGFDSDVDAESGIALGLDVTAGTVVDNVDAGMFSAHQNPTHPLDVNGDDNVSPIDALVIVNWLNVKTSETPPGTPPYRDTNGDGYLTPVDPLLVINHLTRSQTDPPPDSSDIPLLLNPKDGTVVAGPSVTLTFEPLADYAGDYLVRLDDQQWNGIQAEGFHHDATAHYLCLATKQTSITVPVRAGHTYRWWVHKPGFDAEVATFVVAGIDLRLTATAPPPDQVFDPELIDGTYVAAAMLAWSNRQIDVSGPVQRWIDRLPLGATLALPPGNYLVNHQLVVDRRITLTSAGKSLGDPVCDVFAGDCAALIATPGLNQPGGIMRIGQAEAFHHIVLNGNKQGRRGSLAYQKVASAEDNRYGFNAQLTCDHCVVEGNVFGNALGGTGLEVAGVHYGVEIRGNLFAYNGVHTERNLWADGLTVHDLRDSRVEYNEFVDNTDIDLIFGGARNCVIQGNLITHTRDRDGGAFAGLMIQKWSSTSGDYTGVQVFGNVIDGGPNRDIGSGIYLASEGWYDETPVGSLAEGQVASIHDNVVRNTRNGMYIAAHKFEVYANEYWDTHGVPFLSSCGPLTSLAPVVVSPRAELIDFHDEDTDPATQHLFAEQDWRGCIPNWPFT